MRVAVITGGMGGLAISISAKMHAAGYRVVVTHSPSNTKAKDWISEHKASGREFRAYPVEWRISIPAKSVSLGLPKKSDPLIFWSTTRAKPATPRSRK